MSNLRLYPIAASRWYPPREIVTIAKIIHVEVPRALGAGAYGINVARHLDPARVATEIVGTL